MNTCAMYVLSYGTVRFMKCMFMYIYCLAGSSTVPMGYDEVDMGWKPCVGCKRTDSKDSLTLQPCRCSACEACVDDLVHCPSCNTKVRAAAKTH